MDGPVLEIRDLSVRYTTDGIISRAVNNISLEIAEGEILGLVGETGAGKTTTALAMLGLLPKYTAQIEGSIRFKGQEIVGADAKTMRAIRGKHISMIFQDPMTSLNPTLRVGTQIADVIRWHDKSLTKAQVEAQVDRLLETVGIPAARKAEYPHQFSGGMKQRIMIAIAIACSPDLLIADEPTTALDVTIQAQVMKMMRGLQKDLGSSVLLITHDLGLVANFCDRVAIIYGGEIVETGTLEDIFDRSRPHHPYTVGLFGSVPDLKVRTRRLTPIKGLMPHPSELPDGCKFHPRCPQCMEACTHLCRVTETGEDGQEIIVERSAPEWVDGTHRICCHLYGKGADET